MTPEKERRALPPKPTRQSCHQNTRQILSQSKLVGLFAFGCVALCVAVVYIMAAAYVPAVAL